MGCDVNGPAMLRMNNEHEPYQLSGGAPEEITAAILNESAVGDPPWSKGISCGEERFQVNFFPVLLGAPPFPFLGKWCWKVSDGIRAHPGNKMVSLLKERFHNLARGIVGVGKEVERL